MAWFGGRAHDVDDLVEAALIRAEVHTALEALPERERVPIVLAYFGGRTYLQVAQELDNPVGTVRSRIRCGLRRLARAVDWDGAGKVVEP
jgi:RNA polymerase sigma-70 factor, ECF subfamily